MLGRRGKGPRGRILCLGSLSSEQANESGHEAGLGWYRSAQRSEAEGVLEMEYQSMCLWQQWGRWRPRVSCADLEPDNQLETMKGSGEGWILETNVYGWNPGPIYLLDAS